MEGFDVSLRVGEQVTLRKSTFGAGFKLTFAGFPGPEVYSVVVHWYSGYQAAAWNLYLPREKRGFDVAGGHVSVNHVDPESIRFRFER